MPTQGWIFSKRSKPVQSPCKKTANTNMQKYEDTLLENDWFKRAKSGDLLAVKRAIAAGLDVNARDRDGATALMLAAFHGKDGVLQALLKAGAQVNSADRDGWTALMLVSLHGNEDAVRLLLDGGADVGATNDAGRNAAMFAEEYGNLHLLKLLRAGAAQPQPLGFSGWL